MGELVGELVGVEKVSEVEWFCGEVIEVEEL